MTPPVQIEKFYQDYLWVIQAFAIDHASVDAWESAVRAYLAHMGTTERYLIYDLSTVERLGLTSYMNQRTTILAKDNRDAIGRVAIVITLNPRVRYVFDLFLGINARRLQPALTVKLFGTRDEAMAWVVESLPAPVKSAGI